MLLKGYYISFVYLYFSLFSGACWSQNNPPQIVAEGNQAYCPLDQLKIVTSFDIIDDDTEIDAFFIQISTGYIVDQDILVLTNPSAHPNVTAQWNNPEGKMTLISSGTGLLSYTDIIAAVKDVVFQSNSLNVKGEKFFSFTIGDANFLPSNGHYYEFVPDIGITWTNAKSAAESRTYFGLQGYLATVTSIEEAKLTGEQAPGTGWIGGSDATAEGIWKWVTGPETGIQFWNGGIDGNTTAPDFFAFWNTNEPNNLGDENYAHVTAPGIGILGSWNDLSNTGADSGDYQPKGYLVEYGGMPGESDPELSAFTRIYLPAIENVTHGSNCGPGTVSLTVQAAVIKDAPSSDILWFDSESGGNLLHTGNSFTTPILTNNTNYYVLASENGCLEGIRSLVIASIFDIPIIQTPVTLKNCDEDGNPNGFTDFNLSEADDIIRMGDDSLVVTYYKNRPDAESGTNALAPFPYNNSNGNIIYAQVENSDGCYEVSTVYLEVTTSQPSQDFELVTCDDDNSNDGYHTFDLTEATDKIISELPQGQDLRVQYYINSYDAQLEQNEILPQEDYTNEIAYLQTLYIRVEGEDNGDCYTIGPYLKLKVNPLPEFEVMQTAIVCLNLSPVTLQVFNPLGKYDYIWMDQNDNIISVEASVTITSGGVYTVIAKSEFGCESIPRKITATESVIAEIGMDDISIIDNSENNSIKINNENNNLGIGDYQFSLDNEFGPFKEESLFEYVDPGLHTVYAKDKNNCGISSIDVSVIGYPKFFTPNGDGINDTWQVNGVSSQPNSKIFIFDKFGKLLKQIDTSGMGWDGIYNGNLLPSTDYWYMVQLEDGRIHRGHFSLIRR